MGLRRRLGGGFAGASEALSSILGMLVQNEFLAKRAEKLAEQQRLSTQMQDYQTQVNGLVTPENVRKYGPDSVMASYRNLRRRLPANAQTGAEPDIAGLDFSPQEKQANVAGIIGKASKPEEVPLEEALKALMTQNRLEPTHDVPSMLTFGQGLPGDTTTLDDPAFQQLAQLAGSKRSDLLAAEPRESVESIGANGAKQVQFLTERQQGGLPGPLQTERTTQQEAGRQGAITTGTKQAEETVTNNPTNQAGRARGAGMVAGAQKRAELAAELATMGITGQQQQGALALADDYEKASKDFFAIRNSLQNVAQLAKDQTGTSDIGIIYSVMTAFDPGSHVLEGEQATARNAAGVPERIRARFNKLINGDQLTPEERSRFTDTLKTMYSAAKADHDTTVAQFTDRANQIRVPPKMVIREPTPPNVSESALDRLRKGTR